MLEDTVDMILKQERKHAQQLIHKKQELKQLYQQLKVDLQEEYLIRKLKLIKEIDLDNEKRVSMLSNQLKQLEKHKDTILEGIESQIKRNSARVKDELIDIFIGFEV